MNKVYKIIVSACCIILTVLITVRVIYVNKEIYSSPVESIPVMNKNEV